MSDIQIGKYQHYKGPFYEVLGICHHSETREKLVLYKSLYDCKEFGNEAIWVRPYEMFTEEVHYQGKMVPRFQKV